MKPVDALVLAIGGLITITIILFWMPYQLVPQ